MSSNSAQFSREPPPVPGNHPSTRNSQPVPAPFSSRPPPPKTPYSSTINPNITIISAQPMGPDSQFLLKAAPPSEPVHSNPHSQHKPANIPTRPSSPPSDLTLANIRNSKSKVSTDELQSTEEPHMNRPPPPKPLHNLESMKNRPPIPTPHDPDMPQLPSDPPQGIPQLSKQRRPSKPDPPKYRELPKTSQQDTAPKITNMEFETNETSLPLTDHHTRQPPLKPRVHPLSKFSVAMSDTSQKKEDKNTFNVETAELSSATHQVKPPKPSAPIYKPRIAPPKPNDRNKLAAEDNQINSENTPGHPPKPITRIVSPIQPKIVESEPATDITDITVSIQPEIDNKIPSKPQPPKSRSKAPPSKPKPSINHPNPPNTQIESESIPSSNEQHQEDLESAKNNESHLDTEHQIQMPIHPKPPRKFDSPKETISPFPTSETFAPNEDSHNTTSTNHVVHAQTVYPSNQPIVTPVNVITRSSMPEVPKQGPPKPHKPEPPKHTPTKPPKPDTQVRSLSKEQPIRSLSKDQLIRSHSKEQPIRSHSDEQPIQSHSKEQPIRSHSKEQPIRSHSKEPQTDDDHKQPGYNRLRSQEAPSLPPRPDMCHPLYKYVCTEPHAFSNMNYCSENEDFLSLSNGEFLLLLEKYDANWYIAMNQSGDEGYVNGKSLRIVKRLHGDLADGVISNEQPFAVACQDYRSNDPGDLNFRNHDAILLIRYVSDSWIEGKFENTEFIGIFPKEFVEIVTDIPGGPPAPEDFVQGPRAKAIYDFAPTEPGDLAFQTGDIVILTEDVGSEWMKGKLYGNNEEGIFPLEYVKIIEPLPVKPKEFEKIEPELELEPEPEPEPENLPSKDETSETATALYSFESSQPGDLVFNKDDTIINLSRINEEWLQGELNGVIGMFPSQYVRINSINAENTPIGEVSVKTSTTTTNNDLLPRAIALYDFDQVQDGDLCFKKDDVIYILNKLDEDWFDGEVNGNFGIVPFNFVDIIQPLP